MSLGGRDRLGDAIRVAPWGSPPTSLLPQWYIETCADIPLPEAIREENPAVRTIGELGKFWNGVRTPIRKHARHALLTLARAYRPPGSYIVLGGDTDRFELTDYPLRVRTLNAITNSDLRWGVGAVHVEDLLAIKNFGIASLVDLMCVMEAAELASSGDPTSATSPWAFSVHSNNDSSTDSKALLLESRTHSDLGGKRLSRCDIVKHLERLFAAAEEFYGATTVMDALNIDLVQLATDLGIDTEFDSCKISDFTDLRVLGSVIDGIRDLQANLPIRERSILQQFVEKKHRPTLGELGQVYGISRQRVRQIAARVKRKVEQCVGSGIGEIVAVLRRKVGPVAREYMLQSHMDSLFKGESLYDNAVAIARRLVEASLSYDTVRGIRAIPEARGVISDFERQAQTLADDAGLIDEEVLRATLPGEEWHERFELLVDRCGLFRIGSQLAQRATQKARVKAAVLTIGRPATAEEIADATGLPVAGIPSVLSRISGIERATKTKWGMEEWIDDVYEGIAAEIVQRIDEDGGVTTLDRLLRELPEMFEVKEASVRAIVATPQFVLQHRNVRLAKASEVSLRDVYEVVDGVTLEGWPYWNFRVRPIHFDGHSVARVPPEIAVALGCPKNGRIWATVSQPSGCGRISVIWRLTSLTGASIGYISGALDKLEARAGDHVSLVVVESGVVEFRLRVQEQTAGTGCVGQPSNGDAAATTIDESVHGAAGILEQLKNRRRVF